MERLENYLKQIEQTFQVSFVYDATQINKEMNLEVPVKLVSISSALEPLTVKGIAYNIVGKQVILKKALASVVYKKDVILKGRVVAAKDGDP
ncbi:hypothetical protein, partial [Pedobacter sp.]|uniref:hypothetical protein n=1 Tax=Pedobacter sp. TaxID=1411316 RepID=UPI003D7FC9EB